MQITSVSVAYKRTFNLGDYNSATLGIEVRADLEEGDDEDGCLAELWAIAKEQVKAQAMPLLRPTIAQAEEARKFMGKPFTTQNED